MTCGDPEAISRAFGWSVDPNPMLHNASAGDQATVNQLVLEEAY